MVSVQRTIDPRLMAIKKSHASSVWGRRIVAELQYLREISRVRDGVYDHRISKALDTLEEAIRSEGSISKSLVLQLENQFEDVAEVAKGYTITCAGHAHIDMNWMWGWHETVSVTLDTFETMLDLMDEYPDFHFSQSQAAIYALVEKYAPEMFEKIKARVKEGRWEITASTWVEFDKNMSNGESFARHHLYTKAYLADRFGLDFDDINLDFEPDTFGHHANLPEILADGGIDYYYHCRGSDDHELYRWEAPSGRSVLVYREPEWYNGIIDPDMALYVPKFCKAHGLSQMLSVYGVGDHGGGPTRRDLEQIMAMNEWPIFPTFRFGTIKSFLRHADTQASNLPVVTGERNFVFTGCYTSQSRIKMANRLGENKLREAEALSALAKVETRAPYNTAQFEEAWRHVLFNQFHDILPGSGVLETREHAMGLFQESMATALSRKKLALNSIAKRIDTTAWLPDDPVTSSTAHGAGVGFGSEKYQLSQPSYGSGNTRVFHVFNALEFDREEVCEFVVWDWQDDTKRIIVKDGEGHTVPHQVISSGRDHYWGHDFLKLLVAVKVPSMGYNTYVISQEEAFELDLQAPVVFPPQPRVERPDIYVLENDEVRVEMDPTSCRIVSIVHKSSGRHLVSGEKGGAGFRFINEDDRRGMTSWIVGRYMRVEDLHVNDVRLKAIHTDPAALRQWITYEIKFGGSKLLATVSLDKGSATVNVDVETDWHEIGRHKEGIPQLNFHIPLEREADRYRYDIAFGIVERSAMDMDVPANSWAQPIVPASDGGPGLVLTSDSKYGFRGTEDALALTLIRGSYDPDPYPEIGVGHCRIGIVVKEQGPVQHTVHHSLAFNHPLDVVSAKKQRGPLPATKSFVRVVSGHAAVSTLKGSEQGDGLVLRCYETEGQEGEVTLAFDRGVKSARAVDINERPIEGDSPVTVDGMTVTTALRPHGVTSLYIELED